MNLKKSELSVLIALVLTIALSCFDFNYSCNSIRNSVFRIHILANSDSEYDQNLKLKVRDRLLSDGLEVFKDSESLNETLYLARENTERFRLVAEDELQKNGCDCSVTAKVTKKAFNMRTYDNCTLPAGEYYCLQIKIGKAKGKNWWCVMYPSLCVSSSSQKIEDVLDETSSEIVENKDKYIVKFKICEWFETVKSWF